MIPKKIGSDTYVLQVQVGSDYEKLKCQEDVDFGDGTGLLLLVAGFAGTQQHQVRVDFADGTQGFQVGADTFVPQLEADFDVENVLRVGLGDMEEDQHRAGSDDGMKMVREVGSDGRMVLHQQTDGSHHTLTDWEPGGSADGTSQTLTGSGAGTLMMAQLQIEKENCSKVDPHWSD